jgi:hypothetical protein
MESCVHTVPRRTLEFDPEFDPELSVAKPRTQKKLTQSATQTHKKSTLVSAFASR